MPIRDPEKLKEYNRAYYQKNKVKILSQDKEDYKHNHKNVRTKYYLRQYGITVEEYEHMYEMQKGVCKICSKPEPIKTRLCVDHNHTTGKVRGLLCTHCNTALGHMFDNVSLLQNAIGYLHDNNSSNP